MKILLLSGTPICPYVDAAGCCTYHFLSHLGLRHQIDVLQICPPGNETSWPILGPLNSWNGWLEQICNRVWSVHEEENLTKIRYGIIRDFPKLRRAMRRVVFDEYDVIWAHWVNWAYFIPEKFLSKTFLDYRDCYELAYQRQLAIVRDLSQRGKLFIKIFLYRYYLRKYVRSVNTIVMVNKNDADSVLGILPEAKVETIPVGVDIDYLARPLEAEGEMDKPTIVFTGAMEAAHNADAAIYFTGKVFPFIERNIPGCRFRIVGRSGGKRIRDLTRLSSNIEVVENVPDIRPYLWSATVFVAPMISGTGIKTKILEAWAAGCAVVSTSLGCEALEVKDGENLLIADNPKDMARQVIRLLKDPILRARLGDGGKATVSKYYRWETQALKMEKLLFRVAGLSDSNSEK